MKRNPDELTILRTAAGSPPAVSQYQEFKRLGARIVAADSNPLAVGFVFADSGHKVPRVSDPEYLGALKALCQRESVNWILPSLDEELILLASNAPFFEEAGVRLCLSSVDTLRICTDKFATYEFFLRNDIPVVPTARFAESPDLGISTFPQIVKPVSGRGSSNVFVARTQSEVEFFGRYIGEAVVQPLMTGMEYTIDVLANWSSEPIIIVPRKRLMTDSGISMKGVTAWHKEMVHWSGEIVKRLKIVGPANFQCFVSKEGEVRFTEVNARLAGSSILTQGAGIPFYEGIVALLKGQEPPLHIHAVDERVMLRYWSEVFLTIPEAQAFGWRNDA
jgi:carbamoyl-phosphate synthase large subunit